MQYCFSHDAPIAKKVRKWFKKWWATDVSTTAAIPGTGISPWSTEWTTERITKKSNKKSINSKTSTKQKKGDGQSNVKDGEQQLKASPSGKIPGNATEANLKGPISSKEMKTTPDVALKDNTNQIQETPQAPQDIKK